MVATYFLCVAHAYAGVREFVWYKKGGGRGRVCDERKPAEQAEDGHGTEFLKGKRESHR